MPRYLLKIASEVRVWEEECWAADQKEAREIYERKGFAVLGIKRKWGNLRLKKFSLKWKDKIIFTQEFLALAKAGVPFIKALELIMRRTKNPRLKEIVSGAKERIIDGAALSEAFTPYSKDFGMLFVTSLAAGERSGKIEDTLEKYLEYANFMDNITSRIKSALTYPAVVLTVSFFLVFLLTTFVIPKFADFYKGANIELPLVTLSILSISSFMENNWLAILISLFVIYSIYKYSLRFEKFNIWTDKLKLSSPFLGEGIVLISSSIYFRTLSFLLAGGIPIVNATSTAASSSPNAYIRKALNLVPEEIKEGGNLTNSLEKIEILPDIGVEMVRVGEGSGQLEELLFQAADFIEKEFDFKIKSWLAILEPLIILFLGLIVGIMLLSVYLPIFHLARGIG